MYAVVLQTMFHQGSLDRALLYINYSMNNAGFFNAQLRHLQICPLGNLINQSYSQKMKKMSDRLAWTVGGLICLLVVVLLLFLFTIHQIKKLNYMNKKQKELNEQLSALNAELTTLNKSLKESNHVKELFICQYLEVYSEYIRRMSKLARKAGMKEAEELMKNEMAQFYNRFDKPSCLFIRNSLRNLMPYRNRKNRLFRNPMNCLPPSYGFLPLYV